MGKGKKFKRDVAEELVHSEDDDEDLEDIKKMSTAELLEIIAEAEDDDEEYTSGETERSVTLLPRFTNCLRRVRRRSARLFIMASIVRRFQCRIVMMLRNVRKRFIVNARKFLTRNVGKSLTRNVGKYPMRLALMFPMKNAGMNHVNLAGMNLSKCALRFPMKYARRNPMSIALSTLRSIARMSR